MSIKKVWVEKYRPKSVDKVIMINERTRKIFAKYVADQEIPSLLMYGGPGTGKTSISQALIRDLGIEKMDVIKINCSLDKIDAVREKIQGFATTMPIGKFKIVRLEELDWMGVDAMGALRVVMEEASSTCRFIATCNYVNKLTPPMRSRFGQEFEISAPVKDDVLIMCAEILEAEGVEFEVDDLEKVVAAGYPDVRRVINLLQGSSTSGRLDVTGGENTVADWKLNLLPALEASDIKLARKIVCESATKEELTDVFTFLYNNLHRIKKLKNGFDDAIVTINEYQDRHMRVSDPEINIYALFIELDRLVK